MRRRVSPYRLKVDGGKATPEALKALASVLASAPGTRPVYLSVLNDGVEVVLDLKLRVEGGADLDARAAALGFARTA
jgi:hypothetical protein